MEKKSQSFPRTLLKESNAARDAYFRSYTVAHPNLKEANDTLRDAIREAIPGSLIFVFGPSGVGKTTLRLRTEQRITEEMLKELKSEPGRFPVIGLEAIPPDLGNFSWKVFYKNVLEGLNEPCVDHKVKYPVIDEQDKNAYQRQRRPTSDLRHATEQAIKYRRPVTLLVDEAQHLAKTSSGRKIQDELDTLKSLANRTKIPIVLLGTYELLPFRNLSAQLSRRSVDIHFRRYRADHSDELKAFKNVLWSFENHLPLHEQPDLIGEWDYFYERSIGCVGVVKEWLIRALVKALRDGGKVLTRRHLERSAPSISKCDRMLSDIIEGEDELVESNETRSYLRRLMGLEPKFTKANGNGELAPPEPSPGKRQNRKPGQRNPKRDPIGNGENEQQ